MALHEQDREDIMREATALVRRVELSLRDEAETCVIGFRRDGAASIFFGADPVYQFNAAGELRRAFVDGKLVKAEHGKLVRLDRRRTDSEVQLLRQVLADSELDEFVRTARYSLARMSQHVANGSAAVVRQVPEDAAILDEVRSWLDNLPIELVIAARPHAGKRR